MSLGWAAMVLAAGIASAPTAERPLRLQVDQSGGQVIIRLVGNSPTSWSARYDLEVTGGAATSSNHSAQRGTARLQPGQQTTVATLRLANSASTVWTARLHVMPSSGDPYDMEWNSGH
ncbi:MAG TPA: curli-like amyloid fiber formation chaperone CsgH [Sphingomicrobium sp.]